MARRKQPAISDQLLDQLLAGADPKTAFAKDGLLDELKKALAERALNAEIDHHLDKGEEDGRVNSRNGYGRKSVLTETSKIELEVPRDRLSTFDPQLIAKYQRRFPGFDDKIVSMYARGMSVREIRAICAIFMASTSPPTSSARSRTPSSTRSPNGKTGRWRRCMRWCSSTLSGSRCATKAWFATKPSMSPLGFGPTEPRKSSGCGSSKPKARNSGCAS